MTEQASWRSGYVVVFVLFVALLVSYLDRVNVAVLIADPVFLKDMGIADRPDLRGLIMSVFLWIYGASALLLSFSLDKFGARKGLIYIAIVWAIAMFLGGVAWSFSVIIASRIVLGLGEGIQMPLNSMVVKTWAPPRERGMANSLWGTGMFVGSAIAMPFVAWLIGHFGWRTSMFVLGAMSLVFVVPLVLVFLYGRPEDSRWVSAKELDYIKTGMEEERKAKLCTQVQSQPSPTREGWKEILSTLDFWISVLSWSLQTWMFWGLLAWLPSYLKIARGFTWAQMGWLASLPYVLGTISLILSGYIMFRLKRASLLLCAGTLLYAIFMTLAVVSESNLGSALWMAFTMGGMCLTFGAAFVVLQKIISVEAIARATGLWTAIAGISGGFVPYFIGWLIAVNKGSYTAGFVFLIASALVCTLVNMILYLREGRKFGRIVETSVGRAVLAEVK